MYAVIKVGGKQYRVKEGDEIFIEKIDAQPGSTLKIEEVLMIRDEKGIHLSDEVKGSYVEAEVIDIQKGDKIIVFKYRPKKRYRRKSGHRQTYLKIRIKKINSASEKTKKAEKTKTAEAAAS